MWAWIDDMDHEISVRVSITPKGDVSFHGVTVIVIWQVGRLGLVWFGWFVLPLRRCYRAFSQEPDSLQGVGDFISGPFILPFVVAIVPWGETLPVVV